MKGLFLLTGALIASSLGGNIVPAAKVEGVEAKSSYLCDFESGTEVFKENESLRLPIASMCKIMTLLLSFEAADAGNLAYDEMITVSENASSMGGSQVFLQTGLSYSASELMKSVAVCSANDSCVALAERVAGSESAFVDKMNARAKELGAENTLFANCTGLPKEPQYSTAKDVALMLRAMLSHEKYYEFSRVWYEDFAHPDGRTTRITNTNKLVRFFNGCDGGKTGFTNQAGFCLAATAKRQDTRLIAVVIGAESSQKRFDSVKRMFEFAFNAYESVKIAEAGIPVEERVAVRGSAKKQISMAPEMTLTSFREKGAAENLTKEVIVSELKAPILKGDAVGELIVYRDGVEIARCRMLAAEDAKKYTWWEAFRETVA